jgi:hypothetical protein
LLCRLSGSNPGQAHLACKTLLAAKVGKPFKNFANKHNFNGLSLSRQDRPRRRQKTLELIGTNCISCSFLSFASFDGSISSPNLD